mmetsp:Transcript_24547/g.32051  ORF Transcript_24547/g.32051 Transcript_24547/m.32051 type:complete len:257 (-) Transcript_24547:519-1289(-)
MMITLPTNRAEPSCWFTSSASAVTSTGRDGSALTAPKAIEAFCAETPADSRANGRQDIKTRRYNTGYLSDCCGSYSSLTPLLKTICTGPFSVFVSISMAPAVSVPMGPRASTGPGLSALTPFSAAFSSCVVTRSPSLERISTSPRKLAISFSGRNSPMSELTCIVPPSAMRISACRSIAVAGPFAPPGRADWAVTMISSPCVVVPEKKGAVICCPLVRSFRSFWAKGMTASVSTPRDNRKTVDISASAVRGSRTFR